MNIALKTIIVVFALIIGTSVTAQVSHINFMNQAKWEKILKMAKKQNKPIFVDAYTTWCGPCKTMDRDVFTNNEVAAFFNANFISVKMDMEKGEGITLKTDWEIKAYPTLLYFNSNGEIAHRVVGAYNAQEFLGYSKNANNKDLMAVNLQKRYDAGERDGTFMYNYLVSLRLGYHKELEAKVSDDYLSSLADEDLLKEENWNIIKYFMKDSASKGFQFLVTNQDKLAEVVGEEEVATKLYKTIDKQIEVWTYWYGGTPFETEKEDNLIAFLQRTNYDKAPVLLGKLLVNKFKRTEDKEQYLTAIDYIVKFNLAEGSSRIVTYADAVLDAYESESAWAKALLWLNIAESMETRVEYQVAILKSKSEALSKLGNITEAELAALAAKKADKEAEATGTKIHSVPMMQMTGMKPKKE